MHDAGNLSLVGGNLALDFANTAASRDAPPASEHLGDVADLIAWAIHAGGIGAQTAKRAEEELAGSPDLAAKVHRHALELREAIYRIGAALACGREPAESDFTQLKAMAQRTLGTAALERTGDRYRFDFSHASAEAALLGPVAWSAIDLLAKGDFDRLKQCANPGCGWLYLDHSKNKSRRWCDMSTCGNVAKGRRHRQRRS